MRPSTSNLKHKMFADRIDGRTTTEVKAERAQSAVTFADRACLLVQAVRRQVEQPMSRWQIEAEGRLLDEDHSRGFNLSIVRQVPDPEHKAERMRYRMTHTIAFRPAGRATEFRNQVLLVPSTRRVGCVYLVDLKIAMSRNDKLFPIYQAATFANQRNLELMSESIYVRSKGARLRWATDDEVEQLKRQREGWILVS